MEYDKPWLSIEDQIELLVSGKGLECRDIDKLREALSRIGYYRLSAYWFPFKVIDNNGYKVFRRGTTFERILMTYEFDRRLRLLMFEAVSRIEIFLRCRIAHLASEEVGAFGYPEAAKSRLKREYSSAKKSEQYIKHFASKYGDMHDLPPYWMMVECATMGTIELLFSKVSPKVRVAIASEFGG